MKRCGAPRRRHITTITICWPTRTSTPCYIMTPEHLHHDMAMAALKAGSTSYVEKPLAHTIEEGFDIVRVWEKSGKVVQVGTQNRSSSLYKKAKELVAAGHDRRRSFRARLLVSQFAARRSRLALHDSARSHAAEHRLEHSWAPRRSAPGVRERYFQWRLYWDYSGGISTDLLVHQTDIVNFMLRQDRCRNHASASGGIYRWTKGDDRDMPDTFSAIYEYPRQFPHQLQLLFRQRPLRLRRAVVRQRGHHRSDEPPGPVLHARDASRAKRRPTSVARAADPSERQEPISTRRTARSTISATSSSRCRVTRSPLRRRTSASRRRSPATWPRFRSRTRRK